MKQRLNTGLVSDSM